MWKWLQGKKTYIVAAGAIISAIGAFASGQISLMDLILVGLNGGGIASLRSGVKADVSGR